MKVANHKVENINGPLNPVNPTRLLWPGLLLLCSLLKLWLVAGVELGKDEAAYWHWGQHLDATYALLPFGILRLAHALLPYQEWFLRLPSILSSTLATLLLYRLCRLHPLSPERARWAAALFATFLMWSLVSLRYPDLPAALELHYPAAENTGLVDVRTKDSILQSIKHITVSPKVNAIAASKSIRIPKLKNILMALTSCVARDIKSPVDIRE